MPFRFLHPDRQLLPLSPDFLIYIYFYRHGIYIKFFPVTFPEVPEFPVWFHLPACHPYLTGFLLPHQTLLLKNAFSAYNPRIPDTIPIQHNLSGYYSSNKSSPKMTIVYHLPYRCPHIPRQPLSESPVQPALHVQRLHNLCILHRYNLPAPHKLPCFPPHNNPDCAFR